MRVNSGFHSAGFLNWCQGHGLWFGVVLPPNSQAPSGQHFRVGWAETKKAVGRLSRDPIDRECGHRASTSARVDRRSFRAYRQGIRMSSTTGIFRFVLSWYSPNPGYRLTCSWYMRPLSASSSRGFAVAS